MSKHPARRESVRVEGATLYCEVRGAGKPLLLLIPGGPLDAGVYDAVAEQLSDQFAVVAYDPRGNSRSVADDPTAELDIRVHADDAARVLQLLGDRPAFVFGSSAGGQVALCLATHRPELVRKVVAHEPPCVLLLPDAEATLRQVDQVLDIFDTEGVAAAARAFSQLNGMAGATPPRLREPSLTQRVSANMNYFFRTGFRSIPRYVPDVVQLRNRGDVAVGIGEASGATLPAQAGRALAAMLGAEPVVFPGGHVGYAEDPEGFASRLRRLFL